VRGRACSAPKELFSSVILLCIVVCFRSIISFVLLSVSKCSSLCFDQERCGFGFDDVMSFIFIGL